MVETSNTLNPASVSTNVSNEVSKNNDSVVLENHAVKQFKGDFVNMCIVPVCVKLNQNSILTYALLDNCSQGNFIDDGLLSHLGSNFPETELSVKTLTGQEVSTTKVVEGLQVRGRSFDNQWISLPKTYEYKYE